MYDKTRFITLMLRRQTIAINLKSLTEHIKQNYNVVTAEHLSRRMTEDYSIKQSKPPSIINYHLFFLFGFQRIFINFPFIFSSLPHSTSTHFVHHT
mmetsp:Transcript_13091/g.24135  ORF Transcript_13091/g.24135 Transcript_13091/m.24135 type:complete len:96 (+) Transcript_13091:99-386(+)